MCLFIELRRCWWISIILSKCWINMHHTSSTTSHYLWFNERKKSVEQHLRGKAVEQAVSRSLATACSRTTLFWAEERLPSPLAAYPWPHHLFDPALKWKLYIPGEECLQEATLGWKCAFSLSLLLSWANSFWASSRGVVVHLVLR